MHADRKVNVKSVSKTIMSALLGIALRQGHIDSLGQTVASFLPGYVPDGSEEQRRRIDLEHLVTMTTGLEGTSFRNYNPWILSRDWVRYALRQPIVAPSGSRMDYSTGNSHLLSVILTEQSGMSTLAYARRYLFDPLGVSLQPWDRDPQGYYLGGNNMHLTPREMLAFGQLYLHGGEAGGRRILDRSWIERSWQVRTHSPHTGAGYGYGWWHRRLGGMDVWYALGYGGQYIFVIPELETTVVATSAIGERRRRRRSVFSLVSFRVIPAVRDRLRLQEQMLVVTPRSVPASAPP
jgi:CubicO group peptidase (beta-lactamase class C family)